MFRRILIANRGEIACRIIRTCRRLGIETVAVYSDADADALHVEMADRAVHIGSPAPSDSYLRGDAIIRAALDTGAEAIHPGYGFLSENPDFVEETEQAGLVFIGPSAQAIRVMGLKDAAKAMTAAAGVPTVPGYHGTVQDDARLVLEADTIGYPVMIKAVAGGGGKGMRRVDAPDDFRDALASARAEARAAFGNDAVLIEKCIAAPRHIEVQVFGDGTEVVHLFERDCSLQRRHQKVIEEAPAPGITPAFRTAITDAAIRAARALDYKGAGTVEFIADGSEGLHPDRVWFMEMNTRLQVEHPVTEAITGLDLVEWQIRVAAGERLPARQSDITLEGHAVEVRLYAEDVPSGFLPATGRLNHLAFPETARIDTGVRAGDEITPFYDPMIAKLIVHGDSRTVALAKLHRALAETRIAGSATNHVFLRKLIDLSSFAAGEVDTGLIERHLEHLVAPERPCTRTRALAALGALGLPRSGATGFSLWRPLRWQVALSPDTAPLSVTVLREDVFEVAVGDTVHRVEMRGDAWWVDGAKTVARVVPHDRDVTVFWGDAYSFDIADPLHRVAPTGSDDDLVTAPMPGFVRRVRVGAGDTVAEGQVLLTLEAMKMEHLLRAGRNGRISEVLVAPDARVDAGAPLVRFEREAS